MALLSFLTRRIYIVYNEPKGLIFYTLGGNKNE